MYEDVSADMYQAGLRNTFLNWWQQIAAHDWMTINIDKYKQYCHHLETKQHLGVCAKPDQWGNEGKEKMTSQKHYIHYIH